MKTNDYITPTKQSPVFVATCDYFGYIEELRYKDYSIADEADNCQHVGRTFGIHFKDAVNRLHEWIQDNPHVIKEYPKCKFDIFLLDGSMDRYQTKQVKVYTISARKAKQLLF